MVVTSGSTVLSTGCVTLLLFLSVLLPATPAPSDQYGSVELHHGHEPSQPTQLHRVKLQHSGYHQSERILPYQQTAGNEQVDTRQQQQHHAETRSAKNLEQESVEKKELQVGCADGSVDLKLSTNVKVEEKHKDTVFYEGDDDITIDEIKDLDESLQDMNTDDYDSPLKLLNPDENAEDNNIPRVKRDAAEPSEELKRDKRHFIRWYGTSAVISQPVQHTYTSSFQVNSRVPYFIPVWSSPLRIPVFFPYKPILFNPGYPARNPPEPPTDSLFPNLPDETKPPVPTDAPKVNITIDNRFNMDKEGNPIWSVIDPEDVGSRFPGAVTDPSQGITERPNASNRPSKPKTPSLFHRPSLTDDDAVNQNQITTPQSAFRPTQRPPQNFPATQPPSFTFPNNPTTTQRPQDQGPSRCVWAVISCCSPLTNNIRYSCFEQLGCSGAFWDRNPCSKEVTAAALGAAQKFYQQNGERR